MCVRKSREIEIEREREREGGRDREEEVNMSLHSLCTFWKSLPSLVAKHL